MSARVLALALLAGSSLACSPGKREAASLVAAVDAYRQAPMDAKAGPAAAIESVVCTDTDVCAAKDACLASSRPTVHGMLVKREVETALDELNEGRMTREQVAALGLSAKLDEASRAVEEGRAKVAGCDGRVISLRRKYGL